MNELGLSRKKLEHAWLQYQQGLQPDTRLEVLHSWDRSRGRVAADQPRPRVMDMNLAYRWWLESELSSACEPILPNLSDLAKQGDFVAAISNEEGVLLWSAASPRMARISEGVGFVPGGHWGESEVGTNALALAMHTRKPQTVFSAEHFVQAVHDWVCYSAPVIHPATGRVLGVVDLSSTWENANPLALTIVQTLASSVNRVLAVTHQRMVPDQFLSLNVCGTISVRFNHQPLKLTLRQTEILLILALRPEGMSFEELYAALYPQDEVSPSTLKVELSRLRQALQGGISLKHYRLTVPVYTDVQAVRDLIRGGMLQQALGLYKGVLLPRSDSPFLESQREVLHSEITEALIRSGDQDLIWQFVHAFPEDYLLTQISKSG
ncbi:GAF domain-containing protein [Deinococcus cellulosilyticus]|uniref:Transcriptional regulator n=1 Tax=Deinococcus cellulosilyticus (strain DSM 18568 / NBRC 106333 / KACC 11606 / 5516J-15) TaxID=1223518 RepID=A0A511N0U6_DEIC1|nr:helix-turn-helix domain-containing protein [Deinococcus cellulosilyticus]GEM46493.1 transcriptional regulator [Deinococcus cellulosilyticus NBRC 106333 = KACC 11606]